LASPVRRCPKKGSFSRSSMVTLVTSRNTRSKDMAAVVLKKQDREFLAYPDERIGSRPNGWLIHLLNNSSLVIVFAGRMHSLQPLGKVGPSAEAAWCLPGQRCAVARNKRARG